MSRPAPTELPGLSPKLARTSEFQTAPQDARQVYSLSDISNLSRSTDKVITPSSIFPSNASQIAQERYQRNLQTAVGPSFSTPHSSQNSDILSNHPIMNGSASKAMDNSANSRDGSKYSSPFNGVVRIAPSSNPHGPTLATVPSSNTSSTNKDISQPKAPATVQNGTQQSAGTFSTPSGQTPSSSPAQSGTPNGLAQTFSLPPRQSGYTPNVVLSGLTTSISQSTPSGWLISRSNSKSTPERQSRSDKSYSTTGYQFSHSDSHEPDNRPSSSYIPSKTAGGGTGSTTFTPSTSTFTISPSPFPVSTSYIADFASTRAPTTNSPYSVYASIAKNPYFQPNDSVKPPNISPDGNLSRKPSIQNSAVQKVNTLPNDLSPTQDAALPLSSQTHNIPAHTKINAKDTSSRDNLPEQSSISNSSSRSDQTLSDSIPSTVTIPTQPASYPSNVASTSKSTSSAVALNSGDSSHSSSQSKTVMPSTASPSITTSSAVNGVRSAPNSGPALPSPILAKVNSVSSTIVRTSSTASSSLSPIAMSKQFASSPVNLATASNAKAPAKPISAVVASTLSTAKATVTVPSTRSPPSSSSPSLASSNVVVSTSPISASSTTPAKTASDSSNKPNTTAMSPSASRNCITPDSITAVKIASLEPKTSSVTHTTSPAKDSPIGGTRSSASNTATSLKTSAKIKTVASSMPAKSKATGTQSAKHVDSSRVERSGERNASNPHPIVGINEQDAVSMSSSSSLTLQTPTAVANLTPPSAIISQQICAHSDNAATPSSPLLKTSSVVSASVSSSNTQTTTLVAEAIATSSATQVNDLSLATRIPAREYLHETPCGLTFLQIERLRGKLRWDIIGEKLYNEMHPVRSGYFGSTTNGNHVMRIFGISYELFAKFGALMLKWVPQSHLEHVGCSDSTIALFSEATQVNWLMIRCMLSNKYVIKSEWVTSSLDAGEILPMDAFTFSQIPVVMSAGKFLQQYTIYLLGTFHHLPARDANMFRLVGECLEKSGINFCNCKYALTNDWYKTDAVSERKIPPNSEIIIVYGDELKSGRLKTSLNPQRFAGDISASLLLELYWNGNLHVNQHQRIVEIICDQ